MATPVIDIQINIENKTSDRKLARLLKRRIRISSQGERKAAQMSMTKRVFNKAWTKKSSAIGKFLLRYLQYIVLPYNVFAIYLKAG